MQTALFRIAKSIFYDDIHDTMGTCTIQYTDGLIHMNTFSGWRVSMNFWEYQFFRKYLLLKWEERFLEPTETTNIQVCAYTVFQLESFMWPMKSNMALSIKKCSHFGGKNI